MRVRVRGTRTRRDGLLDDDDIGWVRVGSKEWFFAWEWLLAISGDAEPETLDPRSGEVWQYMGSTRRRGSWEHEFRHRSHPRFRGQRVLLRVPASPDWQPVRKKRRLRAG